MAIKKGPAQELLRNIDAVVARMLEEIPDGTLKNRLRSSVIEPMLAQVRELISDSRPPVMHLIGRVGGCVEPRGSG